MSQFPRFYESLNMNILLNHRATVETAKFRKPLSSEAFFHMVVSYASIYIPYKSIFKVWKTGKFRRKIDAKVDYELSSLYCISNISFLRIIFGYGI